MNIFPKTQFVLASSSPRRRELMENFGVQPLIVKPKFDEKRQRGESIEDYIVRNAEGKNQAVRSEYLSEHRRRFQSLHLAYVAADTVVVLDQELLEKPVDRNHAIEMLQLLSGKTHRVLTAMSLCFLENGDIESSKKLEIFETQVGIKDLNRKEIEEYVDSGEPYDKSGAYAIQGKGAFLVESIRGSFSNVVGLPISQLVQWMQEIRFI